MKRLNIFIVDDSQIFIRSLCGVISTFSIHKIVGIADTAEKAIELIPRTNPDLVLVDISIPISGGIKVIYSIRKMPKVPKILVVSFNNSDVYSKMAKAAHADDFLWKADISDKLIPTIEKLFPETIKSKLVKLPKKASVKKKYKELN